MRKQTKVLAAAALFTLGASFSAFAAKTGEWKLEDEGWMCYDKDGDAYTNEWCLSEGNEYYVGDDGVMVTSDWVEYDNNHYYVGSLGTKTVNDWRFVTPVNDEDADEEWFYFDSKGKRVDSKKKVINGKSYYFNNDGVMLTGWVNTTEFAVEEDADIANVVYCDEDGARLSKVWIETYGPEVDVDEDDLANEDLYWYWINKDGKPATGKKANINGETYLFDKYGHMLTGWVAATTTGGKTEYNEIGIKGQPTTSTIDTYEAVYFCGDSDDGHVKKNTWIKTWKNTEYNAADDDNDQYWFWIEKDGKVYVPDAETESAANAHKVAFEEGALVEKTDDRTFVARTLNKKVYAFNLKGEMINGFVRTDDGVLYFGGSDDGARKTGTLSINDNCDEAYKFCFGTKTENGYTKAIGVTGNKGGKLYKDGLLMTADEYKYDDVELTIGEDTYHYIVNGSGTIQTTKKLYEDGDVSFDLREKVDDTEYTVTFHDGKVAGKNVLTLKNSYTRVEKVTE